MNQSSLTVEVAGQTRIFEHGSVVQFPADVGGRQSFTVDQVEFLGYGLNDPVLRHDDYAGKDVQGQGGRQPGSRGPKGSKPISALWGRSEFALQAGAAAYIGPPSPAGRASM